MSLELININCKMTSRIFVDSDFDKKHDNCRRSSRQYVLHCRGFTDVWPNLMALTVSPMIVFTNCHTMFVADVVVWFTGVPVYKFKFTVVWRPSERSFLMQVISSDPVFTTHPPSFSRTQSWQKKKLWWKWRKQFANTISITIHVFISCVWHILPLL